MSKEELIKHYQSKKSDIKKRLNEFESVMDKSDEDVFAELAFCILTPQSRATTSWNTIQSLIRNDLLFTGNEKHIRPHLNAVRFPDNKTKYLVELREKFMQNGKIKIKEKLLSFENPVELREWLLKNVKGLGMKETAHFIRNVGLNKNQLAILDVHILKNLKELGVIDDIPKSLTKKKYLEIENKMKEFTKDIGITLDELDLALWSKETGFIFK